MMETIIEIAWLISIILSLIFFYGRSLNYLIFFQQEDYNPVRLTRWWIKTRSFDRKGSSFLIPALLAGLVSLKFEIEVLDLIIPIFVAAGWAVISYLERDPREDLAKKPLVMTARIKRILTCHMGLIIIWESLTLTHIPYGPLQIINTIILLQIIPFILIVSNFILIPLEKVIQYRYLRDAKKRIKKINPVIIGVTGSFGKTSVKHILGHVLGMHAPTLITPGSVNTLMGITRIIRTKLNPEHKYFVVEMGAYQLGTISRLCKLTPPQVGIVTAVGPAHLERFKSIENVRRAKSELPRSLTPDGMAIFNGDDEQCRLMSESLLTKNEFYGFKQANNYVITDVAMTERGVRFTLRHLREDFKIEIPLFGEHQAMNAAAAFACAHKLGVPPLTIVAALRSVPQISHRLEIKSGASGFTILDDSYNSNPTGFREALKVLKKFKGEKIIITPGMVELGKDQSDEHASLGGLAAEVANKICVVGPERIPHFISGIEKKGFAKENIVLKETMAEALDWLKGTAKGGEVVLIENDLPDIYESKIKF